jgi:uncharacterized protein YndB with AHSA1/START domain
MSDQTVIVRGAMSVSCEEVFDAWLDVEGMRQWMMPGPVSQCEVEMDARVGGRFRILMSGPGMEVVNEGEFRVLERPGKLEFTWISSRWGNQETLVTIELHPQGEGCDLVLTHRRFPAEHSAEQLVGGWESILERLSAQLKTASRDKGSKGAR